jgi:protein-S-isoprenylcysteine O-methyltransferase Ste14
MHISRYQKIFGVGPLGILIGIILLGIFIYLDRHLHHVKILSNSTPLIIAGTLLIIICICWHAWCLRTIIRWVYHDELCTIGPYRFVRHPIYAGVTFYGFLGICLFFNSWILLFQPALVSILYSILVRKEEYLMISIFGDRYQRYSEQTGCLFPKIFT